MKKAIIYLSFLFAFVFMAMNTMAEEDFIIHDGIRFRDSKDTVLRKETLKKVGHITYDEGEYSYLLLCEGKLAGYDDGRLVYLFNNDYELVMAGYSFGYEDSKYDEIHQTLNKKYGEQVNKEDIDDIKMKGGIYDLFTNSGVKELDMLINIDKEVIWKIEYSHYNVIIQLDVLNGELMGSEFDTIFIGYIYEPTDVDRYNDIKL